MVPPWLTDTSQLIAFIRQHCPARDQRHLVLLGWMVAGYCHGVVSGGHLAFGAKVRTTAAVLVALLPACSFRWELDPSTGFRELMIRQQAPRRKPAMSSVPWSGVTQEEQPRRSRG